MRRNLLEQKISRTMCKLSIARRHGGVLACLPMYYRIDLCLEKGQVAPLGSSVDDGPVESFGRPFWDARDMFRSGRTTVRESSTAEDQVVS